MFNPDIYNIIENNENIKKILNYFLYYYYNELCDIIDKNVKKNDIMSLTKKIILINKFIRLSNNNLNYNLIVDKFLIEMWRINNEISRC